MKVKLTNVRLAFPQLFEAKTVNGEGKPAFSATFLLDPTHSDIKAINAAIDQVPRRSGAPRPTPCSRRRARRIRRYPLLFIPLYAILSVDYEVGGIADEGRHGS